MGSRLSVISDTFRCWFIDGIYIFDKLARSAAPGLPELKYSCGSRVPLTLEFTSRPLSKGRDGKRPWLSEMEVLYLLDIVILSLV